MIKCMHFNSVYNDVIFRALIMRRQSADLNNANGVVLRFNFVDVYLNLVKHSPGVRPMKN